MEKNQRQMVVHLELPCVIECLFSLLINKLMIAYSGMALEMA